MHKNSSKVSETFEEGLVACEVPGVCVPLSWNVVVIDVMLTPDVLTFLVLLVL